MYEISDKIQLKSSIISRISTDFSSVPSEPYFSKKHGFHTSEENAVAKKCTYDDKDTPEIPGYVFTDLADCLLPLMQEFFNSDEGNKAQADWRAKHAGSAKQK